MARRVAERCTTAQALDRSFRDEIAPVLSSLGLVARGRYAQLLGPIFSVAAQDVLKALEADLRRAQAPKRRSSSPPPPDQSADKDSDRGQADRAVGIKPPTLGAGLRIVGGNGIGHHRGHEDRLTGRHRRIGNVKPQRRLTLRPCRSRRGQLTRPLKVQFCRQFVRRHGRPGRIVSPLRPVTSMGRGGDRREDAGDEPPKHPGGNKCIHRDEARFIHAGHLRRGGRRMECGRPQCTTTARSAKPNSAQR